ncbi:hypothetical protein Bbelb_096200 [Branchiostoma belcheri]|nr:hypothetical protein Bbelb_096200 [Branchiostoma belcheri]
MTKTDMRKINSFHNSCLRKICNVFWPNKISNAELYNRTGCRKLTTEITGRRLKWLGHVLRMPDNRIPKVALSWRPEGKRKRGRPKTTWRRTVSDDLAAMGLNWRSVNNMAQDRPRWRKKVMALCTSDTLERCTCSGQPSVTCTTKGGTCVPTCVLNKNYCNTGTCSSDLSAARLNCKCPSNFVGDRCDNPQIGAPSPAAFASVPPFCMSPAAFACVLLAALAGFVLLGCVICHLCCAERCGKGGKHKAYNQGKPAVQQTQPAQVQKPPVEQEEQVATVDMSKPAAGDDGTYTNPSLPRSEAGSIMETIQEEPSGQCNAASHCNEEPYWIMETIHEENGLVTENPIGYCQEEPRVSDHRARGIARPVIPAPLPMAGKQRPLAADPGQQEAIENWRRHVVLKAAPPTASLQPEAPSHGSLPKRILETPRIPEASPMLPLKKRAPEAPSLGSLQKDITEAPPIASLQNRIPDAPAVGSLQKRFSEAPPADFLRNRIPDSASDVTDEVAQLTARWPSKLGGGTKSLGRRLPVRAPAGTRPATVRGIYNPGYYDNFGNIKEMSYKNAEEIA